MYRRPVTAGAVKELIDYKRREPKNQDSDYEFVGPERAAFFRGQIALMHIVGHCKSSIGASCMKPSCFQTMGFDRDQFSSRPQTPRSGRSPTVDGSGNVPQRQGIGSASALVRLVPVPVSLRSLTTALFSTAAARFPHELRM